MGTSRCIEKKISGFPYQPSSSLPLGGCDRKDRRDRRSVARSESDYRRLQRHVAPMTHTPYQRRDSKQRGCGVEPPRRTPASNSRVKYLENTTYIP